MTWPIEAQTYGSYQYLLREASIFLREGGNTDGHAADDFNFLDSIVQRGVHRFYNPPILPGERSAHEWSFLRPVTSLSTTTPYATGTITIASGVVTLTGGTFPSTAADGELTVDGGTYEVSTRDGNTQLTLVDTSVSVASASTYTLGFSVISLPTDFADFEGPLTYQSESTVLYDPIEIVPEHWIRTRRSTIVYHTRPEHAAIRPKSLDATVGTRYELTFDYTPDAVYVLYYRYRVNPADLTTTNKMPYGGREHYHTVADAVLAEAEASERTGRKDRWGMFIESLRSSVSHDRKVNSPDFIGYNGDRSDRPVGYWPYGRRESTDLVSYNGNYY